MDAYKENVSELLRYKERFLFALKASHTCVYEVDIKKRQFTFFANSEDIFGVPEERILKDMESYSQLDKVNYEKEVSNYFSHPDDIELIEEATRTLASGKPTTYQARMKAGESRYIWCKVDSALIEENGVPVRVIGVITDINQIKRQMEHLKEKVDLDGFTGLYSKKHAEKLIEEELMKGQDHKHAMILIDLDNFKLVNDIQGHLVGDRALKSVAKSLRNAFRRSDIVGRFGGDEFIILMKEIHNEKEVVQKVKGLLQSPGDHCDVTESIGVAIFPDDAQTFQELFEKADRALYHAKCSKNTYAFFSEIEE